MVLVDTNLPQVLMIAVTSLVGMFGLGMALEGFYRGRLTWLERLLAAAGGLCLIYPGSLTDVIGTCVVVGLVAIRVLRERKTAPAVS